VGDDAVVLVLSDHGHHAAKPGGVFSGEHNDAPPGVLIAAGPGIPAGTTVKSATLLDIAPTILTLLGLPAAADMPGRVLRDLIPGHREPERVPTYADVPREGPALPAAGELDPSVHERLRSLGYLGE
jgi:arylsulfatase A-like enzyme